MPQVIATKCGRCGLELRTGERHENDSACLFRALAELDIARHCSACERPITGLCPQCAVKNAAVQRGTQLGKAALSRAATFLLEKFREGHEDHD